MIEIPMTEPEWIFIREAAKARLENAKKLGIHRNPGNLEDAFEMEIIGIAAEYGFQKLLGHFPSSILDLEVGNPDRTIDGRTVDVKGSRSRSNDLMISVLNKKHSEIYVLIGVEEPKLFYVGWFPGICAIKPERIFQPPSLGDQPRSKFYKVFHWELKTNKFWTTDR